jgi:HEAT repeat protein
MQGRTMQAGVRSGMSKYGVRSFSKRVPVLTLALMLIFIWLCTGGILVAAGNEETHRLDRLIEDLQDEDFAVSNSAIGSLAAMGEASIPALEKVLRSSADKRARRKAVLVLEKIGGIGTVLALMVAIGDREEIVSSAATSALRKMGEEGIQVLTESLLDDDYFRREAAIRALVGSGYQKKDIASSIAKQLKSGNAGSQKAAARVLGELRSDVKSAIPELTEILLNEQDDSVLRLTA